MTDLVANARALVAPGKGILAADESVASATKRLASYGIASNAEMRRQYRDLFLSAPGVDAYLSGAILFEETFAQRADDGALFPDSLAARGIAPGIKVDQGTEPFPGSAQELITNGLIGLPDRLAGFRAAGATFTKWRAVIRIEGTELPTSSAVVENTRRLAAYAKEAQSAGLVPLLEPEVLYEGTHSRARAKTALEETLETLFSACKEQAVDIAAVILKTSMVLSGRESRHTDMPEEVATDTVDALTKAVPRQIAGIVFLSGGQGADQATTNLAAIGARAREVEARWPLTYSFARALQDEALAAWRGAPANVDAARIAFLARLEKVRKALG
jgi:fructose-bisphosphate aldolase class I